MSVSALSPEPILGRRDEEIQSEQARISKAHMMPRKIPVPKELKMEINTTIYKRITEIPFW